MPVSDGRPMRSCNRSQKTKVEYICLRKAGPFPHPRTTTDPTTALLQKTKPAVTHLHISMSAGDDVNAVAILFVLKDASVVLGCENEQQVLTLTLKPKK